MNAGDVCHSLDGIHENRGANLAQDQYESGARDAQAEMGAAADDVVGAVAAFDKVTDFGNFRKFHFDGGGGEAVCAANFLNCVGRDCKSLRADAKQDYGFGGARAARFRCVLRGDFHRAPMGAGARRVIFAMRFSIAALI